MGVKGLDSASPKGFRSSSFKYFYVWTSKDRSSEVQGICTWAKENALGFAEFSSAKQPYEAKHESSLAK